MKILFFGAGPLGSLYAHLLHQAGKDVTIIARDERYNFIHDCDNYALSMNEKSIRLFIRACREGGDVLRKLGYIKRQPFKFNLFYWMPEFITAKIFQGIFNTKYAEIGFALHAKVALDEMKELKKEFKSLINNTSIKTPNIDELNSYIS